MIPRLVLLGATGDLAGRYLLPALAALQAAGRLPDDFELVGAATQEWDDDAFRRSAGEELETHAADVPAGAREALLRSLRYRPVDLGDTASVASLLDVDGPLVAYLALPPDLFPAAITALAAAGLPAGSRIAVEKPFGTDLDSAIALNDLLGRAAAEAGEEALYRVDHVLGLATVQNVLALRLGNPILEAFWNSAYVAEVELLWEETLALEGRADYFDEAGTLKDVVQNHVLQALGVLVLEPPGAQAILPDRKLDVLRALRPPRAHEMAARTRRARYTPGRLADGSGRDVPAYADEAGVDPQRQTETFAELVLELENARWAGTRFVLRAGKALSRRRKMAVVRFRVPAGSELRIGLDGPEDIALRLTGGAPGAPEPVTLTAPPPASELPAYGRVLLDVLSGGSTLSVRGDEAEEAWRVVMPVLEAWADGAVPLEEYPAGSDGPPRR